jgi:hypothetical protein
MVLFKNSQWAVTDWGLEAARPGAPSEYLIPAHRLLERGGIGNGGFYDWPLHLAEKTWVDINAFNEAFVEALKHHKGKFREEVNKKMLLASIDQVHKQARRAS